jgi:hypothetical protein
VGKRPPRGPSPATVEARALQASGGRRNWSTLLDYRDWVSYIYVPIIIRILVLLPYFAFKFYQRSHRLNLLLNSLSQGSRDVLEMSRLLVQGPEPRWKGVAAEEGDQARRTQTEGLRRHPGLLDHGFAALEARRNG